MMRCAPQVMLRSVQFLEVLGGEIIRKMWRKKITFLRILEFGASIW